MEILMETEKLIKMIMALELPESHAQEILLQLGRAVTEVGNQNDAATN